MTRDETGFEIELKESQAPLLGNTIGEGKSLFPFVLIGAKGKLTSFQV